MVARPTNFQPTTTNYHIFYEKITALIRAFSLYQYQIRGGIYAIANG